MPKKLDDCVTKVKAQQIASGKSEKEANSSAYAICSKSTGYKKTGKHSWKKSYPNKVISINESTVKKIKNIAGEIVDTPLNIADTVTEKPIEQAEGLIRRLPGGETTSKWLEKTKKAVLADPTKQDPRTNAKEWAALMGTGALVSHIPDIISGGMSVPIVGGLALANAGKGALIGRQMSGGRDTFLKSTMIPAGTMAITTSLINQLGDHFGQGESLDWNPEARVGLVAGLGAGSWALRNKGKTKQWW